MQTQSNTASETPMDKLRADFEPGYTSLLLAVDSSDHSNRATQDAIELAQLYQTQVTASHVYAAQMHDLRFRQMEGGLPEQFKQEEELERQRDIHDSLISKGLSVITDSYLIQAQQACETHQLEFKGCSLEGKNYQMLTAEANSQRYDLLVMGALGLGALPGSTIGTVCERVSRRSQIDTLIIKDPTQSIQCGPIVVAIDGSKQSYAALMSGFDLASKWSTPLHVVSAFDPYYHYVAFNRIADVLSEEAGKVFRFKEQEKLHEEIIDDGLAKIYQGHLEVAEKMADDYTISIQTHLLSGKPHHAINNFLAKVQPSLLILGKTGIHADPELDIGGNTENLLRNAECALLLTTREYTPQIEMIAEATTSWSKQAEAELEKIPPFVQNMARAAILRYAQQQGHTVITAAIVAQATASLCPVGMGGYPQSAQATATSTSTSTSTSQKPVSQAFDIAWSESAENILNAVADPGLRHNTQMRAEKKAIQHNAERVEEEHILPFVVNPKIKQQNNSTVEPASSKCPFAKMADNSIDMASAMRNMASETTTQLSWSSEALQRLAQIPPGTSRSMTQKASEAIATQQNRETIDLDFLQQILAIFNSASQSVTQHMEWAAAAKQAIAKAPPMVQGMLIKEIEAEADRRQLSRVELPLVQQIKEQWNQGEKFHLDPADPRNQSA